MGFVYFEGCEFVLFKGGLNFLWLFCGWVGCEFWWDVFYFGDLFDLVIVLVECVLLWRFGLVVVGELDVSY